MLCRIFFCFLFVVGRVSLFNTTGINSYSKWIYESVLFLCDMRASDHHLCNVVKIEMFPSSLPHRRTSAVSDCHSFSLCFFIFLFFVLFQNIILCHVTGMLKQPHKLLHRTCGPLPHFGSCTLLHIEYHNTNPCVYVCMYLSNYRNSS